MNLYQNVTKLDSYRQVRLYARDEIFFNSICWTFIKTFLFAIMGHWSKWSEKLIPKQINLGGPSDTLIFNLV